MRSHSCRALSVLIGIFLVICSVHCKKAEKRETALQGLIHIEKELIIEIPQVPRRCDILKLTKHRIDVGDCELYCDEEGEGIPLVLVHGGMGGTHHYFHPHFSEAKKFARVIYYDQRGCGISDYKSGGKYTIDQAADDLDNLRKGLNIEKWVVLGHSYGGLLAQYYATKYPESLAGLVIVASMLGMNVPLQKTRQYDYITKAEMQRMKEIRKELAELVNEKKIPQDKFLELLVFNNHLNGDWKRQNYYRPTREDLARMALYEWKHDPEFRERVIKSALKVDLKGAFKRCPIPTMIMEGNWDLTWNTDKPGILHRNHPGSKLVMFEDSSHNPFQDEPEKFFAELKDFIQNIPEVSDSEIEEWRAYLVSWKQEMEKKTDCQNILSRQDS